MDGSLTNALLGDDCQVIEGCNPSSTMCYSLWTIWGTWKLIFSCNTRFIGIQFTVASLLHVALFIGLLAVQTEKAEQARKEEIEKFSKEQLRQTETVEKVVLPDAHGMLFVDL